MGILDRLGLTRQRFDVLASPIDLGIASPWAEGNLSKIVPSELFGTDITDNLPLGRAEAIAIPAVSKARNLLVSSIAKLPLIALDRTAPLAEQPTWLYRTNGNVSPYERMAWTVDDLIFYGVSLWATDRGADGQIIEATWLPMKCWTITEGNILVNDQPVDEKEVILFNSPFEGLLNIGSRTLRGARDTERAWTARMQSPVPLVEMRIVDDTNLTQEEADAWLVTWTAKHRSGEPAIGITPAGMEMHTHGGEGDSALYLENRNAVRTDVGSFVNIRASMLDGTAGIDSLTYSTTEGERNSFFEFDLPFWTDPIEAALSQDLVVPRGQRIRFDKYENYAPTPTPTGAPTED